MKRFLLMLTIVLGWLTATKATHIQGGGITYQCLGGNQYAVTLKIYFDCGTYNINTNLNTITVTLTNNCGYPQQTLTLTKVAAQTNVQVSQLCANQLPNSECSGGNQPGVWMATFTGNVTLPGQCNSWHFWYQTCCWNTNTNTPGQQSQLFHTTLNNTTAAGGCDSSPVMGPDPIPYMCVNQPNTYSLGATDPNGNNIVYSLNPAQNGSPTNPTVLNYNGGYSGASPMQGMVINPNTGLITVTPNMTGNFIVQVNCTTYNSSGVMIGIVQQQLQIVVINCNNAIPSPPAGGLSNLTGNVTLNSFNSITYCVNQPGCFSVVFTDANAQNIITLTSTVTSALPGATFTVTGTNPVTGTVCWTPTATSPVNSNVTFTGEDNACPITGQNFFNVDVNVVNTCCFPPVMASTPVCAGASNGTVSATPNGTGPYDFVWINTASGTNVSTANNLPGIHTVNNLPAGTYQVTVTDNNGCAQTGTITIASNPIPVVSINPTWNCPAQNTVTLTATANPGGGTYSWAPGGQTTAAITVTPGANPVTHTVTYTLNGCTATASSAVNPLQTVATTVTNPICNGQCNGLVTATVTGGQAPFTYNWSNGASTASVNNLCAGAYTVTVSNANGCNVTSNANVTQPAAIVVNTTNTNIQCNGNCSGVITVNAIGGTGALQYSANNGPFQTSNIFNGLCAGAYTITVRDANNCTQTASVTLTQPPVLTVTQTNANVSTCGNSNGTITVNASGGAPGYQYSINGGPQQNNPSFTQLAGGTHTVTVTDNNGCTASVTVSLGAAGTPVGSIGNQTNLTCFGGSNGSVLINTTGGTAPFTYNINPGPGPQSSNIFNNLTAGSYTVAIVDANNCSANVSFTITSPTQLTYTATAQAATCNGQCNGQITFNAAGATPPYQYSVNNGLTFNSNNPQTGLCAGNINVVVRDANGCLANSVVTVPQPAAITATYNLTNPICENACDGQIVINATGGTPGYQYSVNNGALQSANTLTNLCAGNQAIHIQDANGCVLNSTQVLANPPGYTVNIVSTTPSNCGFSDGGFTVAASGGNPPYQYSANGLPSQSTGVFTFLVGGAYTVVVTDALGCQEQIYVGVNDVQMSASLVSVTNVSCYGGNDGSVTVINNGGGPPISYELNNSSMTQPTGTFNGLSAGTQIVTVYDAGFCVANVVFTITQPTQITFTTQNTNVNCFGGNSGQIVFNNTTGGVGNYQFSISGSAGPFQTSPTFSGLAAGNYNLAVRDANLCIVTGTATLTQPTPVTYVSNVTNLTCNNNSSGILQLVASGGQGTYTHSINNGATFSSNFTFTGLAAGNYNVVINDGNGCSVTGTETITQPAPLVAGYNVTPVTCNASCNGIIQVNANGGTPPYIYSSNGGINYQMVPAIGSLCAASYQVMVQDANSCLVGSTQNVTQPAPVTFTTVITPATCSNSNGTITINAVGGVPAYSYSADNGNSFQNSNQFTGLTSGPYPLMVMDQNNCDVTATVTVIDEAPPVITNVNVTNATCNGLCNASLSVNTMGGTGTLQYSIGGPSQTNNLFTGLCPMTCMVTVTDANGCTDNQQATITEPTPLTFTATPTPLVCHNNFTGAITINANGGTPAYQYSYNNGATFSNISSITGLAAGTYNIVLKDANACLANGQANVTQPSAMTITSQNTTSPSCYAGCNGQATVTVSGGTVAALYTYNWSGGVAGPNQNTAINLCAGQYNLNIEDDNGCNINTSFTVTNPAQFIVASANATDVLCNGDCNGTININAVGGAQYSINSGANYSTNSSFTNLCPGTYIISVLNANNCQATSMAVINEPISVSIQSSADLTYCTGTGVFIAAYASGGIPPYNYQWSNGINTQTQTVNPQGNQIYMVFATDNNGCMSNTDSTVLNNFPVFNPQVAASSTITCPGDNVTLTANVTGGNPAYNYVWNTGATSPSITFVNNTPATYFVIVSDQCQETDTVNINVGTHPLPQVNFSLDSTDGCTPLTVTFTNNTPPNQIGTDCIWTFSDGTVLAGCGNVTATFMGAGCYTATLAVTSPQGCVGTYSQSNAFCVHPTPDVNFYWSPSDPTFLNPNVTFLNWTTGASSYNWDIAGLATSTDQDPYFSFQHMDTGYYQVCLTATSDHGCIADTCKMIHVGDETVVYVPNAFSPDADGNNELFYPVFTGVVSDSYEFMVFDRWGELIFKTDQLTGAWDGTYRNEKCKQDVYVWRLKLRDDKGDRREFLGHVTLLR